MLRMHIDNGVHVFSVTQVCNNFCIMCYEPHVFTDNPSFDDLLEDIKSVDSCSEIYITGGEPTLRDDLHKVVLHLKRRFPGLKVNLITNGRRCSYPSYARLLKKAGVNRVITELFSDDPSVHDQVTQVIGSYQETRKGIRNLLESGLRVEIRVILTKPNLRTVPGLCSMVEKELRGIERFVFIPISIWGYAKKNISWVVPRFTESWPYVKLGISEFSKVDYALYHHPFCVVDKEFWPAVEGVTTDTRRLGLPASCKVCLKQEICPRVWKTYLHQFGEEEFIPVR